jgi:hypothetical protein
MVSEGNEYDEAPATQRSRNSIAISGFSWGTVTAKVGQLIQYGYIIAFESTRWENY